MAGWGQRQDRGAGSTGQVESAHRALDRLGVAGGSLAVRVLEMVGRIPESIPVDTESGETVEASFVRSEIQFDPAGIDRLHPPLFIRGGPFC